MISSPSLFGFSFVVFDGTTAYVVPSDELAYEVEQNEVEVLGKYRDFDEACEFCDSQMDEITNNGSY